MLKIEYRKSGDLIPHIEWRDIESYPNYMANSLGDIWSKDMVIDKTIRGVKYQASITGRLLKPWFAGQYLYVQLGGQKKQGSRNSVHRFICAAFHGKPTDGQEVAHLDGVCTNNNPENLKWVSHKENMHHKIAHGTNNAFRNNFAKAGEKKRGPKTREHPQSKIISVMRHGGASINDIAVFLGMSKSGACHILKKRMGINA